MASYYYYPILQMLGPNTRAYLIRTRPRDGKRIEPETKRNMRSRGRHDPGDGDYVNRWVYTDSLLAKSGSTLGCLAADRWWDEDAGSVYYEPCPYHLYWDGYTWISYRLECRRGGSLRGRWALYLYAYWLSDSTGYYSFRSRTKTWIVDLGSYFDISRHEATQRASSYLDWAMSIDYDQAQYVPGVGGFSWDYSFISLDLIEPELHFTPAMDFFRDRREIGDTSLNLQGALAAAYLNACDGLPTHRGMDNAANALDLLAALKSALLLLLGKNKLGKAPAVADLIKSSWLSYRYVYSTTKADCEELLSIANRIIDLLGTSIVTSNGDYREGEWFVRCSISIRSMALDGLRSKMLRHSASLNGYNLWDLVPFSFIADWFLDVGDWLDTYDKRNMAYEVVPASIWFSVERKWINEWGNHEVYYYRFSSDVPDLSWVSRASHGPRVVTWVKRGLDVVALFG